MTKKFCPDCQTFYPLTPEFFYRRRRNRDGFQGRCKKCEKAYAAMQHQMKYAKSQRSYHHSESRPAYFYRGDPFKELAVDVIESAKVDLDNINPTRRHCARVFLNGDMYPWADYLGLNGELVGQTILKQWEKERGNDEATAEEGQRAAHL